MNDTTPERRAKADREYTQLLNAAQLGQLGPEGFRRCGQLLPLVSESLYRMPGKQR